MKKFILILCLLSQAVEAQNYTYLGTYSSNGTPDYLEAVDDDVSIATLEMISNSIPESYPVPDYNPQYITAGYDTNLKITEEADVFITFVSEGAGYRNVLGFYTYSLDNPPTSKPSDEEITIIFPNVSALGSGGGLRIARMGANIAKESMREIISLSINAIIKKILGMSFKDTQCGAKVFDKQIIDLAFDKPFQTKWLFDVEIFMRMRLFFGAKKASQFICEKPLTRWVHMDGSKLSYKDSLKILFQLAKIKWVYRHKNKPTNACQSSIQLTFSRKNYVHKEAI